MNTELINDFCYLFQHVLQYFPVYIDVSWNYLFMLRKILVCWNGQQTEKLDFPKIPDGTNLGMWKYEINLFLLNKMTNIWLLRMP